METTRTIVCKLDPTPEQRAEIEATLTAFAAACDFAAETARRIGSTNKVRVQKACYREIRERFGLSANLAVRAIARACAALKVPEKIDSTFAPTSIDYDARIFRFHEGDWTFGVTLLSGRVRLAAVLGDYQRKMLQGRMPTSATLVKRRDGELFLHVPWTDPAPEPIEPKGFLGVDLGIKNLAATDDGETSSGEPVEKVRRRYGKRRKGLNRCGTKNARRRLRQIRSRESKFRRDTNHRIANKIVSKAKGTGTGIGLEDLQGIRDRTTAQGAEGRSRTHGWAFSQLRTFIGYKAAREGIPVVFVDPRDTSKTCSECGHCAKANRKSRDEFKCRRCGFSSCADVNAARNIRRKAEQHWADVNRPMAGVDDPSLGTRRDRLQATGLQSR